MICVASGLQLDAIGKIIEDGKPMYFFKVSQKANETDYDCSGFSAERHCAQ
jgi:hypothetical protein